MAKKAKLNEKELEEKTKQAEEMLENKEASQLMNLIIAKTYARHQGMTEEEFLKNIGFENSGKTEDEAIRIAILNLLVETTRVLFSIKQEFQMAKNMLDLCLNDKKPLGEEKNGK